MTHVSARHLAVRQQMSHTQCGVIILHACCNPWHEEATACCAGPTHSTNWWLGACLSTLIPVIYSFTGGMRASVMTDMTQVRE